MRSSLVLATALLLAGSCADATPDELLVEAPTATTRFAGDQDISMAAAVLDQLELTGGMVVVPTDEAIFALDADALADVLAGGLDELIEGSVSSIDYGTTIEGWPRDLGDGAGPELRVDRDGDAWTIDGHRVTDVWRRGDVTVVVIDGVVGR